MLILTLIAIIFFISMFFIVKKDNRNMAREEAEAMRNITEALFGDVEDEDDEF